MLVVYSTPSCRIQAFSTRTYSRRRDSSSQQASFANTGHVSAEAAGNSSMMDQIHFYQAEKNASNSQQQKPESPAELLEAASIQLQKVETLIGIGQYESARQQLRQGAASTIRLDLSAYDRTHTVPDTPQAGKAIVHQVEVLDIALKKSKPSDECRQLVQQIRHDMSALLASP